MLIGIVACALGFLLCKLIDLQIEMKFRYQALNYLLGMSKEDAKKWLDTKNPGCGLKKPSDLNFPEMWDFASKIRK